MRFLFPVVIVAAALAPLPCRAQSGPFQIEPLKEAPPEALKGPIKKELRESGYRVKDADGKTYLDFWLRAAVPASGKPAGAKGAVQFPVLAEGELLGAVRYAREGGDYRDQAIASAVYTLRYGLQPVNGDHLGVSEYRDYALLVPAAQDDKAEALTAKTLESKSAQAAGTNHPAVLLLLAASADAKGDAPTAGHDETKDLWTAVLPLPLQVKGESGKAALPVQLVIKGAAPQ